MTVISQDGKFEWDSDKDLINIQKHGFSFSEILEVFDDQYLLKKFDAAHRQYSWNSCNCNKSHRKKRQDKNYFSKKSRTKIAGGLQ